MAFRPNSVPSTGALQGVDAIAVRDRADDADGSARASANSSAAGSEPAAVVRFGAEALRLARSTMTASSDATSADVSDSGDAPTVPRPANEAETEALLADALGPNETDAALVDTIDGSSTFPRATANDARESAFPRSPEGRPKSGFFLSATAAASDSGLFASATGTTASTFPRVPRSTAFAAAFASQGNAWESTRARAAAADSSFTEARPASAFPRAASSSTADSAAERRAPTAPRAASNMLAASNSGTMGTASISERKAAAAEGLARQSRAQLAAERYAEAQEALGRESPP